MKRCLLAALLILPLLGSDSPKEYDDATAAIDELQGKWQLVAVRVERDKPFAEVTSASHITYRAGQWSSVSGFAGKRGTYTTNPTRWPSHLDVTPNSGQGGVRRYLYRVDGDTLQVAVGPDLRIRPTSFDEEGVTISMWKRVEK
jgi:uncharacterized protein (TIGR03067 family)